MPVTPPMHIPLVPSFASPGPFFFFDTLGMAALRERNHSHRAAAYLDPFS